MHTVSVADAEAPAARASCYHCGLEVPSGTALYVEIDGVRRSMCCAGCQAVAQAIVANQLTEYYRHRDSLPDRPRVALLAFLVTRSNQPVLVIAHRGASAAAPENTLAAFRLAVEQGADFVELDVQESADGEVLVVHESDLMKAAGAAMKIWETDAAQIRTVDIGSRAGPQFSAERVPTLADGERITRTILGLQPETPGTRFAVELEKATPPLERTPRNRRLWELAQEQGQLLGLALGEGTAGGASDGNATSQFTATLD